MLIVLLCVCLPSAQSANDTCITNPTDPECADYVMPPNMALSLINAMCSGMGVMPGCTINKICQKSQYSGSTYCTPFVQYKQLCLDMSMMNNCSAYRDMCSANSVVSECKTAVIPLPSTGECSQLVSDMCTEMPMDGCAQCKTSCEYLQSYSNMCMSMPDMADCADWKTMCSVIPNWPLCSSSAEGGGGIPMMRMYFHTGIEDYILFKQWVPTSSGYYVVSWILVFLFAILYEILKLVRLRLEKQWNVQYEASIENEALVNDHFFKAQAPFRFGVDFTRAGLHFLEVGWGLLIMLVAMTYNVGLFMAVCLGAFFGMFFTGRFMHYVPKASCH